MTDEISSFNENVVFRNWTKGMDAAFPESSFDPSKSPEANVKNRINRRFSMRLIDLDLNISSLLPGTFLTRPLLFSESGDKDGEGEDSYTLTQSTSRNPLYFATPEETSESIIGPTEGMTAGWRQMEYCRGFGGTEVDLETRWKRDWGGTVGFRDSDEGALGEEADRLSAHWTSSSRERLASSPP